MKLLVGLGNFGAAYAKTRHNLGFMVMDELADRHQLKFGPKTELHAEVTEANLGGEKVILAKPTTMMNLSGRAVKQLVRYYKLEPTDVWLVHDELDLDFGRLRIREGAGSAGHNGVASVIDSIGPYCIRWRIGIGRPSQMDAADYVLQKFSPSEQKQLAKIVSQTADAIEHALEHGHEATTHQLLEK